MDHVKRLFFGLDKHSTKVDSAPLRPPWSLPETLFLNACSGCGNCVKSCPEGIIVEGGSKYPSIDFSKGDCTFCKTCVESCADGAFSENSEHAAWNHKAVASDSCLPKVGIACQSCQDSCDVRAISFSPRIGGPSTPDINHEICNGCGACFTTCPSDAISFTHTSFVTPTDNIVPDAL